MNTTKTLRRISKFQQGGSAEIEVPAYSSYKYVAGPPPTKPDTSFTDGYTKRSIAKNKAKVDQAKTVDTRLSGMEVKGIPADAYHTQNIIKAGTDEIYRMVDAGVAGVGQKITALLSNVRTRNNNSDVRLAKIDKSLSDADDLTGVAINGTGQGKVWERYMQDGKMYKRVATIDVMNLYDVLVTPTVNEDGTAGESDRQYKYERIGYQSLINELKSDRGQSTDNDHKVSSDYTDFGAQLKAETVNEHIDTVIGDLGSTYNKDYEKRISSDNTTSVAEGDVSRNSTAQAQAAIQHLVTELSNPASGVGQALKSQLMEPGVTKKNYEQVLKNYITLRVNSKLETEEKTENVELGDPLNPDGTGGNNNYPPVTGSVASTPWSLTLLDASNATNLTSSATGEAGTVTYNKDELGYLIGTRVGKNVFLENSITDASGDKVYLSLNDMEKGSQLINTEGGSRLFEVTSGKTYTSKGIAIDDVKSGKAIGNEKAISTVSTVNDNYSAFVTTKITGADGSPIALSTGKAAEYQTRLNMINEKVLGISSGQSASGAFKALDDNIPGDVKKKSIYMRAINALVDDVYGADTAFKSGVSFVIVAQNAFLDGKDTTVSAGAKERYDRHRTAEEKKNNPLVLGKKAGDVYRIFDGSIIGEGEASDNSRKQSDFFTDIGLRIDNSSEGDNYDISISVWRALSSDLITAANTQDKSVVTPKQRKENAFYNYLASLEGNKEIAKKTANQ